MEDSLNGNIAALRTFWNRYSFHDMSVESIDRINGRVIVTLDEFVLILTGTKKYKQSIAELPTYWISYVLDGDSKIAKLNVSLEFGEFVCEFTNVRLLQRCDYAILIPPFDVKHF